MMKIQKFIEQKERMVHLNVNENQEVSSAKNKGFNNTVSFDNQNTYEPVLHNGVFWH